MNEEKSEIRKEFWEISDNKSVNRDKAIVYGVVEKEPLFVFCKNGQKVYHSKLAVVRKSGTVDHVPIRFSGRNIRHHKLKGKFVKIEGCFQSDSKKGKDNKYHLDLFLKVEDIKIVDPEQKIPNNNEIVLSGFVSKKPCLRETPSGLLIVDFLLAINEVRKGMSSVYIPCIAWQHNAEYISQVRTGEIITVYGRIQSRKYLKKFYKESALVDEKIKETYEISISQLNIL